MAKSNAERQAAYRKRHHRNNLDVDEGELQARLSVMVSRDAKWQLERLATYYGVTQRQALERALKEAEWRIIETLSSDAQNAYYDRQLTALQSNSAPAGLDAE
jgi:hypothetical protein